MRHTRIPGSREKPPTTRPGPPAAVVVDPRLRVALGRDEPLVEFVELVCRRKLDHITFPYVEIETTHAPEMSALVPGAVVVSAAGFSADGMLEPLGFAVGSREDRNFWTTFLHQLRARGLSGVQFVASPAYRGLREAVTTMFPGAVLLDPEAPSAAASPRPAGSPASTGG